MNINEAIEMGVMVAMPDVKTASSSMMNVGC